jgi:hypothetical protein
MGFIDRLFGTEAPRANYRRSMVSLNEQALERYRYMLQTAPPEMIEQAHEEAFTKLTPEQRRQVLDGLARAVPANERAALAATSPDDTKSLARAATRAEVRQPGILERTLSGGGLGLGASLLSSFAVGFMGSMVANSFFAALGGFDEDDNTDGDDNVDYGEEESAAYDGDSGGMDDGAGLDV